MKKNLGKLKRSKVRRAIATTAIMAKAPFKEKKCIAGVKSGPNKGARCTKPTVHRYCGVHGGRSMG